MNGPPQKPIERLVLGQGLPDEPDGLQHERHGRPPARDAQLPHVLERLDRLLDHRADALDQIDVDAHPEDREHDVREHHGRVNAVSLHRLERDLGAELRLPADLEQREAFPELPVAGRRPPGLAHEPDRRPVGPLTASGPHEQRPHLRRRACRRHGGPV